MKKLWTGVLILTLFLLGWVSQKIRSIQTSYDIQNLENELKKEQRRYSDLEMERNAILSLDSLEKAAKETMGLVPIKEENIVPVLVAREGE
ncbi:MAG: hypothetical protein HYY07_03180 [Elusimicrobia bacterium]|nr:hypothetical protein [Elusimicrobiota bacterium]